MFSDISTVTFGTNFAPQANFPYPSKTDDVVTSRGDPTPRQDTVDLSARYFNRETRFELNPETNKIEVKIVDRETNEVVRKISARGVEILSDAIGNYTGKAFHEVTV